MKFYLFLVALFSVITLFTLRVLELSWPLSLVGGLLAFSGLTILLFGCNVQRLLSDPSDKSTGRNFFSHMLKGRPPKGD